MTDIDTLVLRYDEIFNWLNSWSARKNYDNLTNATAILRTFFLKILPKWRKVWIEIYAWFLYVLDLIVKAVMPRALFYGLVWGAMTAFKIHTFLRDSDTIWRFYLLNTEPGIALLCGGEKPLPDPMSTSHQYVLLLLIRIPVLAYIDDANKVPCEFK